LEQESGQTARIKRRGGPVQCRGNNSKKKVRLSHYDARQQQVDGTAKKMTKHRLFDMIKTAAVGGSKIGCGATHQE
jgi:hypothetical protein